MQDFIRKVKNYIDENHMLNKGDTIVMGVSGGADSMALFTLFLALRDRYELKLKVVHVNHGLRPEAKEEADYVAKCCVDNKVDFILKEADVHALSEQWKLGTEEAGRRVRYEAFYEAAGSTGKIAIAHNKNDRAETFLFNLFRGSGPRGLASIPATRDNIIRPLLSVTRSEIEAFLKENQIKFYVDASNLTNDYTRNRIRNEILKSAESLVNNRATDHVAEAAEKIASLNDFAESEIEKYFNSDKLVICNKDRRISFSIAELKKLHPYMKAGLIKRAIDRLVPGNRDITDNHIEDILKLTGKSGNKMVNLPYALRAQVSYDQLILMVCDEGEAPVSEPKFETKIYDCPDGFQVPEKKYTKYFDYDKIKSEFLLRLRQKDDFLIINRQGAKKSLNDYFKNEKIPREERDKTYLIADGNHVMWVIGYRISEYYKVSKDTKRILQIQVFKED